MLKLTPAALCAAALFATSAAWRSPTWSSSA